MFRGHMANNYYKSTLQKHVYDIEKKLRNNKNVNNLKRESGFKVIFNTWGSTS